MKNDNKRTLTPKLRFPEFRDKPGWEEKPLKKLAALINERVGTAKCTPYTVTSGVGLVSQQEKLGRSIAGNSFKNYVRLKKNDFAYNKSATKAFPQGYIARYLDDDAAAVPNSIFTCFRVDENEVDPAYLDYLFAGNLHGKWLKKFLTIGARAHGSLNVDDDDILSLPVPLPGGRLSSAEQQKIAACLSSLDGLIAAEGRKLEALHTHKKGLMQQLFPHPGETRPRLRFPEFRNAPEWITLPLGDLLSRKPEYGVNAPAVPFSEELPTYLRITDIDDDGHFIAENKVSVNIEATEDNYLNEGDIVLARTGASVGKSYRYQQEDGRLVFAGFLIRLSPNPKKLISALLSHYISTSQYWDWVRATSARSGQPGINGTEYPTLLVPIPPVNSSENGLAEQQRIADCLSSLDDLITALTGKLAALQTHKKGLMQQLFPSPEEAEA
jgi:type I restriction enzyme S subunit